MTPRELIKNSNRIVIKIGSALLVNEQSSTVRQNWLQSVANDIATLIKQGKEVCVVSSGAVALGRKDLGIKHTNRPSSIILEKKQAAAALGQIEMSKAYSAAFAIHKIKAALVLLSPRDTEERQSHLNARATLLTLMENKSVPIINENDTVSTAKIRFGDNDRLSARVAQMIGAELLIQLSTTDGLYTADPSQDKTAKHIPLVEDLTKDIFKMAGDAPAGLSTGGMKTKLEAAQIATNAGVHMIITSGSPLSPISNIEKATIFKASEKPVSARKKWISSHVKAEGSLILDDGAVKALKAGKSLLPAGVIEVIGNFKHGDAIEVMDKNNTKLGLGLASYNANEARMIIGHKSSDIADVLGYYRGDELIHRSNLVLQA